MYRIGAARPAAPTGRRARGRQVRWAWLAVAACPPMPRPRSPGARAAAVPWARRLSTLAVRRLLAGRPARTQHW